MFTSSWQADSATDLELLSQMFCSNYYIGFSKIIKLCRVVELNFFKNKYSPCCYMEAAATWLGPDNKRYVIVLSLEKEGNSVKLLLITFAHSSTVLEVVVSHANQLGR